MTVEVHWLGTPQTHRADVVGGKVANLSRLAERQPVPPGFCVFGHSSEELATEFAADGITSAYRELAARQEQNEPAVAVRSSAVDEDGEHTSFAGLNETYLNVVGEKAVVDAVRACVASFRSERALAYRSKWGLDAPDQFAVLVQQLVTADVAGVAFSVDPVTHSGSTVVVNSSWGLGESIVGGTVTPDTYRVDRASWDVTERRIADKARMTVPAPAGVRELPVPRQLRSTETLSDAQVVRTARLAVQLEEQMGWPADVEFAWSAERLYLLQCRPVTALHTSEEAGSTAGGRTA
ncbi:hypothetical protein GCM10017688_32310 [Streptomyces ramulosus]